MPKIYDCFTFWNENDMAEARIEFLYPYVDYFVIVESQTQHDGSKKEFVLDKDRLKPYWDKIIYIQDRADVSVGVNGWGVENHHRNCISNGVVDAKPDDIILISDLDEIPDPKYFPLLKSERFKESAAGFLCDFYNYYVNIFAPLNPCVGTVATTKALVDEYKPQHFRNVKDKLPKLVGGWHMSYLGGVEHVWKKFITSCDVADKTEILPLPQLKEKLIQRLKEGQFNLRHNVDLPVFFVENPDIPKNITKEKYPKFFINSLDEI